MTKPKSDVLIGPPPFLGTIKAAAAILRNYRHKGLTMHPEGDTQLAEDVENRSAMVIGFGRDRWMVVRLVEYPDEDGYDLSIDWDDGDGPVIYELREDDPSEVFMAAMEKILDHAQNDI